MKPVYIFGFAGDGGPVWSGGFEEYLRKLHQQDWADVQILQDSGRDWRVPVTKAQALPPDQPVAGVGYSLGAWGAAWWARYMLQGNPARKIGLIAGIDPAGRGAAILGNLPKASDWPIGPNVERCLCVDCSIIFPLSWVFGGGKYVAAPNGPKIEFITREISDHIWMQNDHGIQEKITYSLRQVYDNQHRGD